MARERHVRTQERYLPPLLETWASYPRENLLYQPLEVGKEHKDLTMRPDETVTEMAEEVLARQAKAMLAQTGQSFQSALEAVASTLAGQQLTESWQTGSMAMRRPKSGRGACPRSVPRSA